MTKRHALNSTAFLLICLVILALVGEDVSARADVFRAAVAPRPSTDSGRPAQSKKSAETAKPSASAATKKTSAQKSKVQQKASTQVKKSAASRSAKAVKRSAVSAPKAVRKKTATKASVHATRKKAPSSASSKSKRRVEKGARKSVIPPRPLTGSSADMHLNVRSALLINMSTGKIYFEQDPDKAIAPASITKLLTLYLVREAIAQGRLSDTTSIPVSSQAVRTGGSSMSLRRGERVPVNELIKGISVVSANNACVAIAEYLGKGDTNRFVAQMNAKAKALGMTQSRFRNPNGLPAPGQLSTARDIARLSLTYLRTFPESLSVHSMTTHTYHGATHRNANSLLRTYRGVDGLKTGFVCSSGYNITATAKRGNTRLLAVVLGSQSSTVRQIETARLLDYGFKRAAADQGDATLAKMD